MYTSYTSEAGMYKLDEDEINSFLNAVGSAHNHIWDERISYTERCISK